MPTLGIRTAEDLKTVDSERQASRRLKRETPLVRHILRLYVDRGGPISVDDLAATFNGIPSTSVPDALAALDTDDIVRVRDGRVDIAYPFSASPTAFRVRLATGTERYACCATDALGIAAMVGQRIEIRSRCHHCGMPLQFSATPIGPGPEAAGVMLWIGKRIEDGCKAADSV